MVDKKITAQAESSERYYTHEMCPLIPEGEAYPSVTTILQVIPKPGLYGWYSKEGTAKALEYRNLIRNEISNAPLTLQKLEELELNLAKEKPLFWLSGYEQSEIAKERGTVVHACIEEWAKTGVLKGPKQYAPQLKAFRQWLDNNEVEVVACEIITYSPSMKYAGRCDLVCRVNGRLALVDIKVGKNSYDAYGFQLSAYRQALKELGGDDIEDLYIVRLDPETGKLEVVEYDDGFDIFLSAFQFWNKLKEKTRRKKKKNAKTNTRGQKEGTVGNVTDSGEVSDV